MSKDIKYPVLVNTPEGLAFKAAAEVVPQMQPQLRKVALQAKAKRAGAGDYFFKWPHSIDPYTEQPTYDAKTILANALLGAGVGGASGAAYTFLTPNKGNDRHRYLRNMATGAIPGAAALGLIEAVREKQQAPWNEATWGAKEISHAYGPTSKEDVHTWLAQAAAARAAKGLPPDKAEEWQDVIHRYALRNRSFINFSPSAGPRWGNYGDTLANLDPGSQDRLTGAPFRWLSRILGGGGYGYGTQAEDLTPE